MPSLFVEYDALLYQIQERDTITSISSKHTLYSYLQKVKLIKL